ncbi:Alpha/Beta hydrolase protein [Infundibulicybe gibba]|nr:Alpha/Beta hydrolase protein [Infundibulicybe gibba]
MRYAAAPTGPLRWRAPQTPQLTTGIQQANAQPAMCFSAGQGNAGTSPFRVSPRAAAVSQSEDCLFLNVYTPGNLTQAAKNLQLGGYMAGSASGFSGTDIFNGDDLIREANGGVVAVIIQYRLGVFGFLPGAKVKQGGDLNAGLLDQDFAFRWVQKHIHQFNGDPRRVTIWGESAGAGSVLQHVIANDGNTQPPLFRAAISSSSYLPSQYRYDDVVPEYVWLPSHSYASLISRYSCASATDSLSCLRAVDAGTLEGANVNIGTSVFFGTFVFVPVVDGTFIRQGATEAFKQRKVNGEAIMAVTNTFEGALFVNSSTTATVQTPNYVAQLFPLLEDIGAPIDQAVAIMGESIFICPTYSLLRAFGAKAFKGEFAIPPGGHGNDVVYYFPNGGSPPFANPDFDKAFSESFLNFAMSLNPGIKSDPTTITPKWNAWEGSTEMLFNKTEAGAPDIQSDMISLASFWESVAATTGQ